MVFAMHQHESATGIHVFPATHPEPPSHLPSHPIPLGCPRALVLSTQRHAFKLHWPSILHMVMYMFQCYSLKSSDLKHFCRPLQSSWGLDIIPVVLFKKKWILPAPWIPVWCLKRGKPQTQAQEDVLAKDSGTQARNSSTWNLTSEDEVQFLERENLSVSHKRQHESSGVETLGI